MSDVKGQVMKLTIQEVMTRSVISISSEASIDEAISLLLRHHISGLPVVDEQNHITGVISERDLLGILYDLENGGGKIDDYATKEVLCVDEDSSLIEAVDLFLSNPIRRLPVVDKNNKLVGVVSRRDLIRFIRDMRMKIAGVLEKRRQMESSVT